MNWIELKQLENKIRRTTDNGNGQLGQKESHHSGEVGNFDSAIHVIWCLAANSSFMLDDGFLAGLEIVASANGFEASIYAAYLDRSILVTLWSPLETSHMLIDLCSRLVLAELRRLLEWL